MEVQEEEVHEVEGKEGSMEAAVRVGVQWAVAAAGSWITQGWR